MANLYNLQDKNPTVDSITFADGTKQETAGGGGGTLYEHNITFWVDIAGQTDIHFKVIDKNPIAYDLDTIPNSIINCGVTICTSSGTRDFRAIEYVDNTEFKVYKADNSTQRLTKNAYWAIVTDVIREI